MWAQAWLEMRAEYNGWKVELIGMEMWSVCLLSKMWFLHLETKNAVHVVCDGPIATRVDSWVSTS